MTFSTLPVDSEEDFQSFPLISYGSSPTCWELTGFVFQALIDEDRLLSRLEVMGSQLQAYSKVMSTLLWPDAYCGSSYKITLPADCHN